MRGSRWGPGTCADTPTTADIREIPSHGANPPQDVLHFPVTRFESVWETETTAMAGRHRGMGHVDRYKSMGVAIQKKARGYGDGGCGGMQPIPFRNRWLPCLMATGMVFTNARPSMALTFSVELMLGTSPLAFACPADEASPLSASTPRSPPPNKGTNEALAQLGKNNSSRLGHRPRWEPRHPHLCHPQKATEKAEYIPFSPEWI